MDVQRQEDGDFPASISDVPDGDDDDDDDDDDDEDAPADDPDDAGDDDDDADNANDGDAIDDDDDVADDDDDDMDNADCCDEIVACLHADYDESEEDPILVPRKRPREDDDSPDSVHHRPLKILDHCSTCKRVRYLLYHLLKRLFNLLPSDYVLLLFGV